MAGSDVSFDVSGALRGFGRVRKMMVEVADLGARRAAEALLRDSIPFIPVLTGRMKDSGGVVRNGPGDYTLGWTAESDEGFHYSERQYREAFTHVQGFFAAEWVDKAQEANPDKYIGLVAQVIDLFLTRG